MIDGKAAIKRLKAVNALTSIIYHISTNARRTRYNAVVDGPGLDHTPAAGPVRLFEKTEKNQHYFRYLLLTSLF